MRRHDVIVKNFPKYVVNIQTAVEVRLFLTTGFHFWIRKLNQKDVGIKVTLVFMADSHELRSSSFSSSVGSCPSGEVDHVELLASQLGALLHSNEFHDVTFVVEGKEFPAH